MNNVNAGWVYILSDQRGFYKIGKAAELEPRIKQLKIQLPYKVEVAFAVYVHNRHEAEQYAHNELGEYRVNGEWFESRDLFLPRLIGVLGDLDPTFSNRNTYSDIQDFSNLRSYRWNDFLAFYDSETMPEHVSREVYFTLFTDRCLDEACDYFGLPRNYETQGSIAPHFWLA